ncbi:MAG: DUF1802 family protein [Limnothrix sp. RL_2_0]|nr:DUF1802 family protein [Limnothrix sp. RL_2_0]
MNLINAIGLDVPNIYLLGQGFSTVILSQVFHPSDRKFALSPIRLDLPITDYYHQEFADYYQRIEEDLSGIQFAATCIETQMINDQSRINELSKITHWQPEYIQRFQGDRRHIFLTYLRVYSLPQPILLEDPIDESKLGRFIAIPKVLSINKIEPILTDARFNEHCQAIKEQRNPLWRSLENLMYQCAENTFRESTLNFGNELKTFINPNLKTSYAAKSNKEWMTRIASVGNSSDGHEFEKLVRRSFSYLGFEVREEKFKKCLDYEQTGGAGGLDLYTDYPYKIVGECKSTKHTKVPDGVAAQLIKLGYKHLQDDYKTSIKIIIAAGLLTTDAELTASNNKMNLLRPETLEKMANLQAQYPGAIDLYELKKCLEIKPFGDASDEKINEYLDQISEKYSTYQKLITCIHRCQQKSQDQPVTFNDIKAFIKFGSDADAIVKNLGDSLLKTYLIELSSPFTGYIGKVVVGGQDDKFYWRRDLFDAEV